MFFLYDFWYISLSFPWEWNNIDVYLQSAITNVPSQSDASFRFVALS